MNEQALWKLVLEFSQLQDELITAWRSQNPDSFDVDGLLDFPRSQEITWKGIHYSARVHGSGVLFESPGVQLDVTFEISKPRSFDAGRIYDFAQSRGIVEPEDVVDRREQFAELLRSWHREGRIQAEEDSLGRAIYRVA